jgi:hypothetical protein
MTIDQLRKIAEVMDTEGNPLVKNVARVVLLLREMDPEALGRMIDQSKEMELIAPEELRPAVWFMRQDLYLVKTFVEIAKQYDRTEEGIRSFESVFGEITDGKEEK